jgi:hypothetical protein
MNTTIQYHDFKNISLFHNVIQSKLFEARQHLKSLELYKEQPCLLGPYTLNSIANAHEDQEDFIRTVSKNVKGWKESPLTPTQKKQLSALEENTKYLESTVYHILYLLEHLNKKRNAIPVFNHNDDTLNERACTAAQGCAGASPHHVVC